MWREVLKEYAGETTLHGFRYLTSLKGGYTSRLCWLLAILVSASFAVAFVSSAWHQYQESPTRTSVETTNFPLYRIPFPSITVCPATKVRRTVGQRILASYLNLTHINTTMEIQLWHVMAALAHNHFPYNYRVWEHLIAGNETIMMLQKLNVTKFMLEVLPPLQEIFDECYWQGIKTSCPSLFFLQRNEGGFCYAFNSLTSENSRHCPPLAAYESGSQRDQCQMRRNIASGPTTGLELFMKASSKDDSLGAGQRDANGLRMMVQPVTEVPESGRGLYVPQSGDHVFIVRLSVALTESSAAIASLGPDKRNCLFADERRLLLSNTYSQRTCLMDCRLDHVLKSCRCAPYYFNHVPGYPICKISDIACIARIDWDLRFFKPQGLGSSTNKFEDGVLNCSSCLPTCHSYEYSMDVRYEPNSHLNVRDGYIDIHYSDISAVKYRRELTFDTVHLIVSFGGIMGLFLGVSVLSCAELVYYFTRLFNSIYTENCNRHKITELQPSPENLTKTFPKLYPQSNVRLWT